jgi:hypothetical protein
MCWVAGEDLTPFRDASKDLYSLVRAISWNGRVERLGLDEVSLALPICSFVTCIWFNCVAFAYRFLKQSFELPLCRICLVHCPLLPAMIPSQSSTMSDKQWI